MKIFVYSTLDMEKPYYVGLDKEYGVELEFVKERPTVENAKLAAGADAVSVITTPITGDVIQALYDNGVKYISTRNIGYDHIDIAKAKEIGVGVGNSSYKPESVAEYSLMMILMALRKVSIITDAYKKQDYTLAGKMGSLLCGAKVGVIGTGKIGFTVIKLLSAFGCEILAYDPFENEEVKNYARYVDVDTLMKESDIITLHAPSNKETEHIINKDSISKMKKGVIIVNAARGTLIDTDALIEGLDNGTIGFAALDVLEGESSIYYKNFEDKPVPLKSIEQLSKYPNVILTPHTAFYTQNAIEEMVCNSIKSCVLEIKGEKNPWRIV